MDNPVRCTKGFLGILDQICPRRLVSLKYFMVLADDLDGLLVGAEPEEDGMAHLRLICPLGEFYLAYELGN